MDRIDQTIAEALARFHEDNRQGHGDPRPSGSAPTLKSGRFTFAPTTEDPAVVAARVWDAIR